LAKECDPSGIRKATKPGETRYRSGVSDEAERAEVASPSLTAKSGSKVARLALVAMNAVRNGDLHRAVEVLQGIHDVCSTLRPGKSSEQIG
jgi:hypothetical protein